MRTKVVSPELSASEGEAVAADRKLATGQYSIGADTLGRPTVRYYVNPQIRKVAK